MQTETAAIICEYNPFHYGHQYHIQQTKALTHCKNIICVMSGSMVQRGEPAIADKWSRAKCAIDAGADLVVELPAFFALQSAENFAFGAVKLICDMKIADTLSFGSENGTLPLLSKAANILYTQPTTYKNCIKENLDVGFSYPLACSMAMQASLPEADETFFLPNNTLGICYLSALLKLNSNIEPFTVARTNQYHAANSFGKYKSATEIRKMLLQQESTIDYAPELGSTLYRIENAETFILGFLRSAQPEQLAMIKGMEPGLEYKLISAAKASVSFAELCEKSVSKRYTLHRIKRLIACAILGISGEGKADYLRVLGFNANGAALLKKIKEQSDLQIVTKTADYSGENRLFQYDVAATDFASLCAEEIKERISGKDYRKSPYVFQAQNFFK